MTSVFLFCLRPDNLEFALINQVVENIQTETISIASFWVTVVIIDGTFFFQTKYVP